MCRCRKVWRNQSPDTSVFATRHPRQVGRRTMAVKSILNFKVFLRMRWKWYQFVWITRVVQRVWFIASETSYYVTWGTFPRFPRQPIKLCEPTTTRAGNTKQLQKIGKMSSGLDIKTGQAARAVHSKSNLSIEAQIGPYFWLPLLFLAYSAEDPAGTYILES